MKTKTADTDNLSARSLNNLIFKVGLSPYKKVFLFASIKAL